MKRLIIIFLFSLGCILSNAQRISLPDLQKLQKMEKELRPYANWMVYSEEWVDRFRSDSFFIRGLVQALKTPNSFYYNFDSINTISKLYAPDSSFKIFTWQLMQDYSYYRQHGAIQMRTPDGSLKLFPLIDFSEFTNAPTDSVRDTKHWIGAIYYKIILKTYNTKTYYTLLGSDDNNERSNKKWIEILTFDDDGIPQFGANCFTYPSDDETKPKQPVYRFCMEYKKDGGVRMNYDPKYDEIIFDHLVSENDDIKNKASLVAYGDFEAFRWMDGGWKFVSNPFAVPNTPSNKRSSSLPAPLLDDNGFKNEKKLLEQSRKNMLKATTDPNRINDKQKPYQPGQSSYD